MFYPCLSQAATHNCTLVINTFTVTFLLLLVIILSVRVIHIEIIEFFFNALCFHFCNLKYLVAISCLYFTFFGQIFDAYGDR